MNSVFDTHCKKYDLWYERYKFAFLAELEAIKKVLPKDAKGLEIGVGTGRFASALGITMGIDPSYDMLKIARERGVSVRWGVGEDLPFLEEVFDYIAIIITLCFVQDPKKVLEEAARTLKKDGSIIIGIVDRESFLGRFYLNKKGIFYQHAKFFSVSEVTDLLREAGFKSFLYYQALFELPVDIDSVEIPESGFGKGGFVVVSAKKAL